MSKGDTPRPLSVEHEVFASNWDLIFKKPKAPEPEVKPVSEAEQDDLCIRPRQDAN